MLIREENTHIGDEEWALIYNFKAYILENHEAFVDIFELEYDLTLLCDNLSKDKNPPIRKVVPDLKDLYQRYIKFIKVTLR